MKAVRRLLGFVCAALLLAATVSLGVATATASSQGCGAGKHGSPGYAYAGHQSAAVGHGVRASISLIRAPQVLAGHAAGWIGVGGPGQGPDGTTEWIQVGVVSLPNTPAMVYAEVARPGTDPVFLPLLQDVQVGETHQLAVLEMTGNPNHWRVWLDGQPVTEPVFLPGSHRRWEPQVTAESFNNGQAVCNVFGFRFERVGVARGLGGSWRAFVPGYDFLDRGLAVKELRAGGVRTLSAEAIAPYAFEALSI